MELILIISWLFVKLMSKLQESIMYEQDLAEIFQPPSFEDLMADLEKQFEDDEVFAQCLAPVLYEPGLFLLDSHKSGTACGSQHTILTALSFLVSFRH